MPKFEVTSFLFVGSSKRQGLCKTTYTNLDYLRIRLKTEIDLLKVNQVPIIEVMATSELEPKYASIEMSTAMETKRFYFYIRCGNMFIYEFKSVLCCN